MYFINIFQFVKINYRLKFLCFFVFEKFIIIATIYLLRNNEILMEENNKVIKKKIALAPQIWLRCNQIDNSTQNE